MATTGESKMTTATATQTSQRKNALTIGAIDTTPHAPINRKVIDLSKPDDKAVVMIGAFELSNIASDIYGAMETLGDISSVLNLIHRETVDHHQAKNLARLSHECAETWENILLELMRKLNPVFAQTGFSEFKL